MADCEQLAAHLARIPAAPVLFVGSGLSRRFIGLETWADLLRRFADRLDNPFEYYLSKADGRMARVASMMASDFHEVWWHDKIYKAQRDQKKAQVTGISSPLKIEIASYIEARKYQPGSNAAIDQEVALFKAITVDSIITTNWDSLLETFLPEYTVFVGQQQLLLSTAHGIAEIYKIHGSVEEPNSLVLTEEDYDQFNARYSYLAAKLLTIFAEHPVVFLGYSLEDENIHNILRSLAECLTTAQLGRLRDRLIVVQWEEARATPTIESSTTKVGAAVIPVTIVRADSFAPVLSALGVVRRALPAGILRQLKEQVYELVASTDPKGKLHVLDLEAATSVKDLEVVYGVGVSARLAARGYRPLTSDELLNDVIQHGTVFDAKLVLQESLPWLLRVKGKYQPVFKYMATAGRMKRPGMWDCAGLDPKVASVVRQGRSRLRPPKQYAKRYATVGRRFENATSVVNSLPPDQAIFALLCLPDEQLDADGLYIVMIDNIALIDSPRANLKTYLRAVICLYDWVRWGR